MPLEYMEGETKYYLRMKGATENFSIIKKVLISNKFEYIKNLNQYTIDKSAYKSATNMLAHINAQVEREAMSKKSIFEIDPLPELTTPIPLKKEMFPYQGNGVAYMMEKQRCFNGDQQGLGKAQAIYSKVLTPSGWQTIGKMKVGDEIFTQDGTITKVTGVFPQGIKKVFKVEFSDGSFTHCCEEHLWVHKNRTKRLNWKVDSLAIINKLMMEGTKRFFYIPMVKPIQFPKQLLPIDPYFLGLLLGDGCMKYRITYSSIDKELIDAVEKESLKHNCFLTKKGKIDFQISSGRAGKRNVITEILRELKLIGQGSEHKFIPKAFLYAGTNDRISILQGLLDTDGCVRKKDNNVEYSSSSYQLALDVQFLVQSLGGTAKLRFRKPFYRKNGLKIFGKTNYRMSIIMPKGINPFRLSRKKNTYRDRHEYPPMRKIVKITPVHDEQCVCISVAHPSRLYVTDQCIVTHNTIQAIAAAIGLGCKRILVITKLSLCYNWQKEIEAWTYRKALVFRDSMRKSWPMYFQTGMVDIGIVNYDGMEKFFVEKIQTPAGQKFKSGDVVLRNAMNLWDCYIVDESHYFKDPYAKRTKIGIAITRGKPNVFLLSGTIMLNKAEEIYPQLCMLTIETKFATDLANFKKQFGGKNGNLKLLNALLHKHCYVRRLKKDVLPDLPEKMRQTIIVELDNQEEYNFAENHFVQFLTDQMRLSQGEITKKIRAMALVQMMELKKISARGKLSSTIEWMKAMNDAGQKVVVFAHHNEITAALIKALPGTVSIVGDDKNDVREANKVSFMTDPNTWNIVCSIGAAAEGHTLTAASNLALHEFPWHFGKMEQIEDRIHRIGQKDGAQISAFIGKDTIDQRIYDMIMIKKEIHDGVTGTDEEVPNQVIDSLINLFTNSKAKPTTNDPGIESHPADGSGSVTRTAPPLLLD